MTMAIRMVALLAAAGSVLLLLLAGFQMTAGLRGQETDALVAWIGIGIFAGLFLIANALTFRCLGPSGHDCLLKVCIGLNGLLVLLSAGFLGLTVAYGEVLHAYYLIVPIWSLVIIGACWGRRRSRGRV